MATSNCLIDGSGIIIKRRVVSIDIHDPKAWLQAAMESVPEEHQESFGQMQAIREYRDCIASLPAKKQERLWTAFNEALDERFPSRSLLAPELPKSGASTVLRPTDEEILERVVLVFQSPGDQSPEFHEMLYKRAMGMVERELSEEGLISKVRRRRRLAAMIRGWMKENLNGANS